MGSAGTKSVIAATVLTLFFTPVMHGGKHVANRYVRGRTYTINCVFADPIWSTPENRELGIVGKLCQTVVVRRIPTGRTVFLDKRKP